jgi:hypothetical protein
VLFTVLWPLIQPIIMALFKALLPWLIDRITADIKAGRPTVITDAELKSAVAARKATARAAYRG